MKNFLNRFKANTWATVEACLNKALSLCDSEKILGKSNTTRRMVSLSVLISTVLFFCGTICIIVGLFNTIRGK